VTDPETKKDLTIAVTATSILKRFPEEMAQRMAQSQMGGGIRPGGQAAAPAGAGQAGGSFPGARGGGTGIGDLLERFPSITLADLKAGDVIAVSSPKYTDPDQITAIQLLVGVEPFIRAAQMAAGAQQGRPQRTLDLNIPGLDGFGTP
jgi:hypothetical protein